MNNPLNGSSPGKAAPLGTTMKTTVERGHAYMVPRLYNVEIKLEEIVRGESAEAKIGYHPKEGGHLADGGSLAECYECLLTRLEFGYFERGRIAIPSSSDEGEKQFVAFGGGSVDVTYTLAAGQFAAMSAGGEIEYEIPSISQQPQPSLVGREFHPGEKARGWLLFQVPCTEKQPLLVFKREHVEGVAGIWGYIWFQLYG
jgi:hypothetical protein